MAPNRTCRSFMEIYPDPSHHPASVAVFATLYSIVFVISLVGNSGVIYATFKHKVLQTVQNIFIANLAVADVIMALLSIPLTPVTTMAKQWYFGGLLCRLIGGIQAMGLFIGTFSLCAIAVDRYFRLVINPGHPLKKENAIRITFLLWIISILASAPYSYHMKLIHYPKSMGICGEFCTEKWSNVNVKRTYTLFVLLFQFVIPFVILTWCYHKNCWIAPTFPTNCVCERTRQIFSFLRRRAKSRLTSIAQQANLLYVVAASTGGETTHHREQKQRILAQKRRITYILILMIVLFFLTNLPHNLISALLDAASNDLLTIGGHDFTYLLNLFTHFFSMLSAAFNPCLYAYLNPEFRQLLFNNIAGVKWAPSFIRSSMQPTQTTML